jgi:hypothetical protein
LAEFGARSWQIELIVAPIAAILGEIEPLIFESLPEMVPEEVPEEVEE